MSREHELYYISVIDFFLLLLPFISYPSFFHTSSPSSLIKSWINALLSLSSSKNNFFFLGLSGVLLFWTMTFLSTYAASSWSVALSSQEASSVAIRCSTLCHCWVCSFSSFIPCISNSGCNFCNCKTMSYLLVNIMVFQSLRLHRRVKQDRKPQCAPNPINNLDQPPCLSGSSTVPLLTHRFISQSH